MSDRDVRTRALKEERHVAEMGCGVVEGKRFMAALCVGLEGPTNIAKACYAPAAAAAESLFTLHNQLAGAAFQLSTPQLTLNALSI